MPLPFLGPGATSSLWPVTNLAGTPFVLSRGGGSIPAPDPYTDPMWTATAGDNKISVHIISEPNLNGGTLIGRDVSLDGGLTKYETVPSTGPDFEIVYPAVENGTPYDVRIRPDTAEYAWPSDTVGWSDTKTRTPVSPAPTDYIEIEAGSGYIEIEAGSGYIQLEAA